ncbi:MAG: ATP-binding protein [Anaerolineales bacterium]
MIGFAFIANLLNTLPGTAVYHLLIFLGLLPAAGIAWIEWRETHNDDLQPFVYALGALMGLRILGAALAPSQVEATSVAALFTAPFLYAIEPLSIFLLLWAFGTPLWLEKSRTVLGIFLGIWALCLLIALVSWRIAVAAFPLAYNDYWQVPVWYGTAALLGVAGGVLCWSRRAILGGRLASLAFFVLAFGSVLGLVGSLPGFLTQSGEGLGRLIALLGYPLFAIVLYQSALQDLQAYRLDLHDLSEQALRQSQELLFLIEATKSIGESLDLRGMLGDIVEHVAMALNTDRVAIFLRPEDKRGVLNLVANYELLGRRYSRPVEVSLAQYKTLGFALHERQVVYRVHEDFAPLKPLFELLKVRREGPVLLQPLTRQGRTVGVLLACNDHSGKAFTEEQERLATTIAVQIAGAVENSRLYRELQEKASEISRYLAMREEDLQRQDAIFESMVEGLLVSDSDGNVLLMNKAAEEILHTSREQVLGQELTLLVEKAALESTVQPELLVTLDEPLNTLFDMGDRKIRVNAAPVRMEDGARLGVAALLQDVTREYLAEEAKREFIASISHELRTPLTAIKGYAELLLSDIGGRIPPTVRQFVGVIRENALRMNFITNNLISVAEVERGKFGLSYQTVKLPSLLREVVGRYKERIQDRQLTVQLDLPEDLPRVEIDPHRVRQILDNLLSNAVKFTYPEGHVVVGVRSVQDSLGDPDFFSLWVADTGVGIKPEEQPHIWERFYRADNPLSLEAGGLGIGLTIVKALAEAHGGRVWVQSTPDEGSTFTVLLPMQRREAMTQIEVEG